MRSIIPLMLIVFLTAERCVAQAATRPSSETTRPSLPAPDPALYRAIVSGDENKVRKLLDAGSPVNTSGDSPLSTAFNIRKIRIAKLLLERGADPDSRNHYGCTVLYCAVFGRQIDTARLLLASGAKADLDRCLHFAARNGDDEMADCLIGGGAKIDARISTGETALLLAAGQGHLKVVMRLLQHGADKTLTSYSGETAETLARRKGFTEVADAISTYSAATTRDAANANQRK